MLVTPGAYDYGVQFTMDPPQTGGLSGATLDEARLWGKLEKDAENVSVYARRDDRAAAGRRGGPRAPEAGR